MEKSADSELTKKKRAVRGKKQQQTWEEEALTFKSIRSKLKCCLHHLGKSVHLSDPQFSNLYIAIVAFTS